MKRELGLVAVLAAVVGPAMPVNAAVTPEAVTPAAAQRAALQVDSPRASNGQIVGSSVYDYAPTVMVDGRYRMWWCGGDPSGRVPGDDILYAESASPDGPFSAPRIVLEGTGADSGFDNVHTCDPSIVRARGTYYMFYGGAGDTTRIGVASSPDGLQWTRLNNGEPIIGPANQQDTGNTYGAGQPSVTYVDGRFYLMFTDTTGAGAHPNGAGQFVWRSADPTFKDGTEVFTADGWRPRTAENDRSFAVVNGFSVDWQYVDALDSFVVANHRDSQRTTLEFLDGKDLRVRTYDDVQFDGAWVEGPGLVSRPDKHAVPSRNEECGRVPIDVMHASSNNGAPQALVHKGIDVFTGATCADTPAEKVAAIYESWGVQAAGLPAMVVTGGRRLQVENAELYKALTRHTIEVSPTLYHRIPEGASVHTGAKVLGAEGRPAAFLLGDELWAVSSLALVTANGSTITSVSPAEWDSHPRGPDLYAAG